MRRNKLTAFDSESELANAAVAHFKADGYTVYPELHGIDFVLAIPDLTVPGGKKIIAVEAKLVYSLKVITQAWQHRRLVHEVAICIPASAWSAYVAKELMETLDIGVYTVTRKNVYNQYRNPEAPREYAVDHAVIPEGRHYLERQDLLASMIPEAETWTTPGHPSPRTFTPWRVQEIAFAKYVAAHPGCTVEELLRAHHNYGMNKRTGTAKVVPINDVDRLLALCQQKTIRTFRIAPDQWHAGRDTRLLPPEDLGSPHEGKEQ